MLLQKCDSNLPKSLKVALLLLIEFVSWALRWLKRGAVHRRGTWCAEALRCRWPFKTCFASARAFHIWEQQQTVTVSYLCCCSALLRIELSYITLADKEKKNILSDTETESSGRPQLRSTVYSPFITCSKRGISIYEKRRSGNKHRAG